MRQLVKISFEKVEAIERVKKNHQGTDSDWKLTHFKVLATSAENTDTLPRSVGVRSKEGHRSLIARSVEKDIMDTVGHEATRHPTESHRKEDGKVVETETAREHRRVASSKAEKVEPKGEAMEEERKVNVSTNSENLQKNGGQVDLGNGGQGSPDKLKPTV